MSENLTIERLYSGATEQSNAMNAVADRGVNRDLMASFYADCLIAGDRGHQIDWLTLNTAIIARWPKGLVYIKERAWREARTGVPVFKVK